MKPLIAQNGLEYHVSLHFRIPLTNSQNQWFQKLFEGLITYTPSIDDKGFVLQFKINVNEDIGSFGGFKDVPGKTEVNKFMPILLTSPNFLNSDILFLSKLVKDFICKEKYHNRKVPVDLIMLDKKIVNTIEAPEILINNLVHSKNKRKP